MRQRESLTRIKVAPPAKAESMHKHGCKDMEKHADRNGAAKGSHSEMHADCGPGAKEKQKSNGEGDHRHDQEKEHKHS
jgi:hypothetical protein